MAPPISGADFALVQKLIKSRAGLVIDLGKEYLVESRLAPLARQRGLGSIAELVQELRRPLAHELEERVVDAMTTNETSFFRDHHPFAALKDHLIPAIKVAQANTRRLRIWCGASSSGQEPYSIAMTLCENFPDLVRDWDVKILATDISPSMLERARSGIYSQLEINRGLPATYLVKYFQRDGSCWQVKEAVRELITYRQLNLTLAPWRIEPQDLVFLRNVLIYFDVETKKAILGRIRQLLLPHGQLLLGAAETTLNLDANFERTRLGQACSYRLKSASSRAAG